MRPVVLPLSLFGVAITASALSYPGGSYRARGSAGYSFWHNFWCDLLSTRALNGDDNLLGSVLSRLAFVAFALALAHFWPRAAALSGPSGASKLAHRLGLFGAAALLVVAVVPAATSQLVHGLAVVVSAGCSIAGVMLLIRSLVRRGEAGAAALGGAVALTTLVCLAQYVYQGFTNDEATWLAGMQKITTAFLLAFMVQLTARHRTRASEPQ
ncbi:MAG: hypothetical protein ABW252_15030 [Polyangiales bacterium]